MPQFVATFIFAFLTLAAFWLAHFIWGSITGLSIGLGAI